MDPVTISLMAIAVGTAVSTVGSIVQGKQMSEVAKAQGDLALQKGAAEEARIRDEKARIMASQRTGYGASGLDISSGSPLAVLADTATEAELDALRARWTGESENRLQRFYAGNYKTASYFGAGSTILTGASKILSQKASFDYLKSKPYAPYWTERA